MVPFFAITANDTDITELIAERLLRLEVTDRAGLEADTCRIVLDNAPRALLNQEPGAGQGKGRYAGAIAPPRTGAELQIELGFQAESTNLINRFAVSQLQYSGRPDVLTIDGTSTLLQGGIKAPQNASWHGTTIGAIVQTIAERYGLQARIGGTLRNVAIPHWDQYAQSDMAFLSDLAARYDAVVKFAQAYLVFVPAHSASSVSGQPLPVQRLDAAQLSSYHLSIADRTVFLSVRATYRTEGGDLAAVTAGEGTPQFAMRTPFANADNAQVAAEALLKQLAYGTQVLTLTMPGNTALFAESPLEVTGLPAPISDHRWIIDDVQHVLDRSGLKTKVTVTRLTPTFS